MQKCEVVTTDFESDHRLLMAEMKTPTAKKARQKRMKVQKKEPRFDPKDLENTEARSKFIQAVTNEITMACGLDEIGSKLVKCLESAAKKTLKILKKPCTTNELWKNDTLLNSLLAERKNLIRNSDEYKRISKEIKNRVNQLRNEKLANEAAKINQYATQREVEQLYRSFKDINPSFKTNIAKQCEPQKLREFFQKHFQAPEAETEPIELEQLPDTIKNCRRYQP